MRGELKAQTVVTKEQYLKHLLTATIGELDRIHAQLCKPVAGRYEFTKKDLVGLKTVLECAAAQVREVDADSSKSLAVTLGDFV